MDLVAGDKVKVREHKKDGYLSYKAFEGILLEDAGNSSGWDVVEVDNNGERISIYCFSIEREFHPGDKVCLPNEEESIVIASYSKENTACCLVRNKDTLFGLNQETINYWNNLLKAEVIPNVQDFFGQQVMWFRQKELKFLGSYLDKKPMKEDKKEECSKCKGTGVLHFGFYDRDCECKL